MDHSSRDLWNAFEQRGFQEEVASPRLSISTSDAQRLSINLAGLFVSPPNSPESTETQISTISRAINEDNQLLTWLKSINMSEYWETFSRNDITFDTLTFLTKEDLKSLIHKVGDRIRIENAINDLFLNPFGATDSFISNLNRDTPTSARSPSALNTGEYKCVTVRFFTLDDKALHLEISQNKPLLTYIFQSAKLPSNERFFLSDGFDIYTDDESLKSAIFTKDIREFWIQSMDRNSKTVSLRRDSSGSNIFSLANQTDMNDVHSLGSTSADDRTLTLSSEPLEIVNKGERPTSLEVTKNISQFFPNSKKELLDAGLRNSMMINNRLSTVGAGLRASIRMSRRLSSISGLARGRISHSEASVGSDISPRNQQILKEYDESFTPDDEFLEKLEHEEMSPTEWLKGKLIGSGSFGSVYLAFNVFSGDILAVKQVQLLLDQTERQKKIVDALEQEIKMLRVLDHKNIVQYRGFKKEGQYLNIFLEYIAGGSLASRLASNGPFKEYTIRHYISQCLSGLEYLHERGIIHRDIKGANILVNADNQVKISDFGLSKHEDATKSRFSMQGTAFWMAPEVARAKDRTTTKADIWSLGCLIIEMVTGQHPFPKLQAFQAIFKIGNGAVPEIPSTCSPELQDLIASCLVVDPTKRCSATELLKHEFFTKEHIHE